MPPKTSIFLAYFHTKKEDSKRRHQKIHVTWSEAISMKLSVLLCSFHESDSGRGDTMGFEVVGRVWVFFVLFLWFLLLYLLVLIAICFRDLWYFWIAAVHLNGRQLRWTIHKKSTLDTMRATASSWKLANWNTGRFCSLPSLEKHENTLTVLEIFASAQI